MAKKNSTPKTVKVLTQKLRDEFQKVLKDTNDLLKFLNENNIDPNGLKYKFDENNDYNHYIFFDCLDEAPIEAFQYFIDKAVDFSLIGHVNSGCILHTWVVHKDINKLKLVLEHGANPNIKNSYGNTPIVEFIRRYGDGKMEEVALNNEYVNKPKDFDTELKFIELLLKHGADPTIKNNYGESALSWIQERKEEGFDDDDNKKLELLVKKYFPNS